MRWMAGARIAARASEALAPHHDADRNPLARIPAVVQIISVVIVNVNVVARVPVYCPVFWPRVKKHEPKPAVLEARIPRNYREGAADAEPVLTAEIESETVVRNVVTTIAAALIPRAMLDSPVLGAILLPRAVALPSSALL